MGTGALLNWISPRTLGLVEVPFFAATALIAGTMLARSPSVEEGKSARSGRGRKLEKDGWT